LQRHLHRDRPHPSELAHRATEALPAALQIAGRLGPRGHLLATRAQSAFVDGLGLAMVIATTSLVLVAAFVFVSAPKRGKSTAQRERRACVFVTTTCR
jgi:hypothetical protein